MIVPPRVEHLVDAGAVLVHGGAQGGGAEHASVRAGVVAHEQGDAPGIAARELASRRLVVDGGVAAVCRPTNVRVERGVLIEGGLGQGAESGVGANANRVKREVGGGDRARQRPFAARPGRGSPLVELTGGGPPPLLLLGGLDGASVRGRARGRARGRGRDVPTSPLGGSSAAVSDQRVLRAAGVGDEVVGAVAGVRRSEFVGRVDGDEVRRHEVAGRVAGVFLVVAGGGGVGDRVGLLDDAADGDADCVAVVCEQLRQLRENSRVLNRPVGDGLRGGWARGLEDAVGIGRAGGDDHVGHLLGGGGHGGLRRHDAWRVASLEEAAACRLLQVLAGAGEGARLTAGVRPAVAGHHALDPAGQHVVGVARGLDPVGSSAGGRAAAAAASGAAASGAAASGAAAAAVGVAAVGVAAVAAVAAHGGVPGGGPDCQGGLERRASVADVGERGARTVRRVDARAAE